jgi:hypothetical protein
MQKLCACAGSGRCAYTECDLRWDSSAGWLCSRSRTGWFYCIQCSPCRTSGIERGNTSLYTGCSAGRSSCGPGCCRCSTTAASAIDGAGGRRCNCDCDGAVVRQPK